MDSANPYELLAKSSLRTKQSALRALCMSSSKSTSPYLVSRASCLNNNYNRQVKHAMLKKAMLNYSVSLSSQLGNAACCPLGVPLHLLKAVPWIRAQLLQPFCAYSKGL